METSEFHMTESMLGPFFKLLRAIFGAVLISLVAYAIKGVLVLRPESDVHRSPEYLLTGLLVCSVYSLKIKL